MLKTQEFLTERAYTLSSYALTYVALRVARADIAPSLHVRRAARVLDAAFRTRLVRTRTPYRLPGQPWRYLGDLELNAVT